MKKIGTIVAILLAVLMIFGCASTMKPVDREAGVEYKLTILHTNDHHGATLSKDGNYGLAERATFIKSVRAANENVLLLDAGDINTGSALSNMYAAEPDILAYNAMGYEAITFGNHEFDGSLEKLQKQMEISNCPFLAANITDSKGNFLGEPYIIKDYPGFRVGVLGLTTLRTLTIASPDKDLVFADEIETATEYVKLLKEKMNCDIIIVLGHLGDVLEESTQNTSVKLAENVEGIDIIV
ncbi:MAG: metallophosphoesterase, partial [Spirochaetaceae bacterium]|nr:metallophosphoesterase [Spirochaetaceae bacterium]